MKRILLRIVLKGIHPRMVFKGIHPNSSNLCLKELSLCHKLWFSYPNIFPTQWRRPNIFQTLNSVRSINLSLKYQKFTPWGCKDKGIRRFLSLVDRSLYLWIEYAYIEHLRRWYLLNKFKPSGAKQTSVNIDNEIKEEDNTFISKIFLFILRLFLQNFFSLKLRDLKKCMH